LIHKATKEIGCQGWDPERLLLALIDRNFSKSHDGKGANGSKNRPDDAYPVRCRVAGHYEPCSERVCVCQLKKCRLLKNWPWVSGLGTVSVSSSPPNPGPYTLNRDPALPAPPPPLHPTPHTLDPEPQTPNWGLRVSAPLPNLGRRVLGFGGGHRERLLLAALDRQALPEKPRWEGS
jgi:hypothetical protein